MSAIFRISVLVILILCAGSVSADDAYTAEQIVAAWKQSGQKITQFEATYALETTTDVVGRGNSSDPFGEPPATGAKLQNELTYCFDGAKRAYRYSGDKQGFKGIYQQAFQAVFDGQTYQQCVSGEIEGIAKPQPMGEIDSRGQISSHLTRSSKLVPFYLCHAPAAFLYPDGDITSRMTIERQGVSGKRRYLVVTLDDGLPDRRTTLLLLPDEDFLPVRWLVEYQGKPIRDLYLRFRKTDSGENYVAGWNDKIDEVDGSRSSITNARLSKATVNQPVAEKFTIDFPVGAYVFEDTPLGRRYYEQGEDKTLVPISEEEFGSLRE